MSVPVGLSAGIDALGLAIGEGARRKLANYLALVDKWNRVYNLTAVRDVAAMVPQHVLDSLAVVPHINGRTLLDVGSGAGLPGIPLALALPETRVVLLEANHKKSAFLTQAMIELGLDNIQVVNARVEHLPSDDGYDVVISRAFSDLAEFAGSAGRLVAPGGVLAAMKGVYPFEEVAQLPPAWRVESSVSIRVPGLDAERHLLKLARS